jgi:hypothetical protein
MKYATNTNMYTNKIDEGYRQLGYAAVIQAVKDYLNGGTDKETPEDILKKLRGEWLNALSDGTAKIAAERLLVDAEGIKERIFKAEADEKRKEELAC